MLIRAKELKTFTIDATDGEIGQVLDFYFDEDRWTVRYIVVDSGAWFSASTLLVSPAAIFSIDSPGRYINTSLSRLEVKNSPTFDRRLPLLRHSEIAYHDYFHYAYYWAGPNLWGSAANPSEIRNVAAAQGGITASFAHATEHTHVHSAESVNGFQIAAVDSDVGYIKDFLLDDETWAIRYLIIDTGNWWPGKQIMLAPQWATEVRWAERRVYVDLALEDIKNSPEFYESGLIDRAYEQRLHNYYGRSHYWRD